jgi:hypothetical protein
VTANVEGGDKGVLATAAMMGGCDGDDEGGLHTAVVWRFANVV